MRSVAVQVEAEPQPATTSVTAQTYPIAVTRTVEVGADADTVTQIINTTTVGSIVVEFKRLSGTQAQQEPMFR